MTHPYASQAKASMQRRLSKLGGSAGKGHGSAKMEHRASYPSKNAGSETPMTLKGKPAKPKSGYFAIGGMVGKKGAGKKKHGPTTNVNIVMPQKDATDKPVPVPVPVPAGGPPVGAMPPPRPMGPPPVGLGGPPPGLAPRPPGLKHGGGVKKAAHADEAQDRKLFKQMEKDEGPETEKLKRGGAVFKKGGGVPLPKLTGGGDSGVGRLEKSKATFKGAAS